MITNEKRQAIVTALKAKVQQSPGADHSRQQSELLKSAGLTQNDYKAYISNRANWDVSPDSIWIKLANAVGVNLD